MVADLDLDEALLCELEGIFHEVNQDLQQAPLVSNQLRYNLLSLRFLDVFQLETVKPRIVVQQQWVVISSVQWRLRGLTLRLTDELPRDSHSFRLGLGVENVADQGEDLSWVENLRRKLKDPIFKLP